MTKGENITLEKVAELSLYEWEDRAKVAVALLKNGYTIGPGRRKKTPTGKQLDYFLEVYKKEETENEVK